MLALPGSGRCWPLAGSGLSLRLAIPDPGCGAFSIPVQADLSARPPGLALVARSSIRCRCLLPVLRLASARPLALRLAIPDPGCGASSIPVQADLSARPPGLALVARSSIRCRCLLPVLRLASARPLALRLAIPDPGCGASSIPVQADLSARLGQQSLLQNTARMLTVA